MASTLGEVNPLTYRGYVYDTETGLYYLQSRYYDPEVGRFLNADAFPSTGQGILGNNMFAYCKNNPVLMEDKNGESATIAGAIIGGIFGAINGIMSGGSVSEVLACAVVGAATGALAGLVADVSCATFGVGGAIIASAIAGGISGGVNSYASQSILNDGNVDMRKVASDAVFGAVMGGLCTSMCSLSAFKSLGLKEGIKFTRALLATEEIMIFTQPIVNSVAVLAFDVGASAVTGFGAFAAGLAYDYYTAN